MKQCVVVCLLVSISCGLGAEDFRESRAEAWTKSTINDAALSFYGKSTFSTIKKNDNIQLTVPGHIVRNSSRVPIHVYSTIKAKSLVLFYDKNPKSLIVAFSIAEGGVIDYGLEIAVEFKGTLFAVIEDVKGNLHYKRAFVDVLCLSCMSDVE